MGNSESSSSDPRFAFASRAFTQKELEDLKTLFVSLAAQSRSNGQYISPSVFKSYFGIEGPLGDRMFDLVTQKRNDKRLTYEDLVIAKATYERGTRDEIEEFIYELLDANGDGTVGRSDVEAVLMVIFDDLFSERSSGRRLHSHQDIVSIFLNAEGFFKSDEGCVETVMSLRIQKMVCPSPICQEIPRKLVVTICFRETRFSSSSFTACGNVESNLLLLKKEYAWHIGGVLSQQEMDEWKLLYHSSFNGLSFNTFLGSMLNDEGPTVLIVKDKEGYIYGGYASQPWERHADFMEI